MTAIPMFFQIEEQAILIVGGGRSAGIKLHTLLAFTKNIRLVSKDISENVEEICRENGITPILRSFMSSDLQNVALVFASATSEINKYVHSEAQKQAVLCCKAEGGGDFSLPAIKKEGDLTAAVSTNGKFPMLAKKILRTLDLSSANQLDKLEKCRRWILDNTEDREKARRILAEIAEALANPKDLKDLLERIGYESN